MFFKSVLVLSVTYSCLINEASSQSDLNGSFNSPQNNISNDREVTSDQGFGSQQSQPQQPPLDPAGTTTTTPSPAFSSCMNGCRTVQHYNPVCGSDGVTYNNEFRLQCANRCGARVQMVRGGTCVTLRK